ncbi:related to conserved oligomeric Golgi complex component 6 [Pseudozyma flocculosa]|uniref:Conserved oligomeric Golgi complex subunit 6 n=1 Tax=Pseudozyma flocculosa TaxID=84751 RepID=A0A5C3EZF5_9BASI|nr:related to conserved oligomeric Golgi complex component 6 [Pseudozyma flocculosa]
MSSAATATPPAAKATAATMASMPSDPSSSSSSSSSTALPSTHPISRRIRSILVQPTQNEANLRHALDTLAHLYPARPSAASPADIDAAVAGPSKHPRPAPVDTARARRNVERDARKRILGATDDLIALLGTVDDALTHLGHDVDRMHASCDDVESRLRSAAISSRYLVEHAEGLERQRQATQLHRHLSSRFLDRFTLSSEERDAIHSRQVRVGSRLFAAIDHLDRIRADCRILLEGSDPNGVGGGTRAATDIMAATAQDLELAYQKIFKWCSFEFRQPVKEGLEVSRHLREAVQRLMRARPDLLRQALSTLVATRSSILTNAFVAALTVGGSAPTYLPRPIELHAHDPLRYVGDMLAWIHQTLASEREFLTALFGEKEGEGGRRIGQRRRGLEGSVDLSASLSGGAGDAAAMGPGEALVREVLNRNLEGCCRPLKIRVQQTVRSQEGSVTTYRLAHLVHFYRQTMEKTIGTKAVLSQTLAEISTTSLSAFYVTLDRQAAGLSRFDEAPDAALSAPPPLVGVSATLKELLAEYQRSLADVDVSLATTTTTTSHGGQGAERGLDEFDTILEKLVDPMLDLCRRMARHLSRPTPATATAAAAKADAAAPVAAERRGETGSETWESAVFLENCYAFILDLLRPYGFTKAKVEEIQDEMRGRREVLVDLHTTPTRVSAYLGTFNEFLASPEVISPSSHLARLDAPTTRAHVHTAVLSRLTDEYGEVVDALKDPRNRFEWKETLVRRSKDDVALLLGLQSS